MTSRGGFRSTWLIAGAYCVMAIISLWGGFRQLDDVIASVRFGVDPRGTTGDVVFVDIDARSLEQVGVWPWPRHIHADVLDKLMELGAEDVVFDIDFSVASSEAEDARFAASLENAGGYAYLAAFQQQRVGERSGGYNLPLDRFRQFAQPVAVNVILDEGGLVRTYPFAMGIGPETIPSVAALFSGVRGPANSGFDIDYSIDPHSMDRISVADLLDGTVAAKRIEGKQVVVGASAVELRDYFVVPRFGVLPGALLQALAAETLKQNRGLQHFGHWPAALVVGLIGLVALLMRRRVSMAAAMAMAAGASVTGELVALAMQTNLTLLADTAPVHAATVTFALTVLATQLVKRGQDRLRATRERDAVRLVLDRVITDNFDGVVVVDAEGKIISVSDAAETLLQRNLEGERASMLPGPLADLVAKGLETGGSQGEVELDSESGARLVEYVVTRSEVLLGEKPAPVVCLTFRDVTEKRASEDRLRYMGGHDSLTGALRRTRLFEDIEHALADPSRELGVVVVNLRRFRFINDTLGHGQGDFLLRQVASRLRSMGPDAVARLGGDSFALVVPDMSDDKLKGYCQTVAQWLSFPYQLADGHQAIIAASAGATTTRTSGRDAEVLLSHADMALSAAKQITGNGVALFTPDMDDRLKDNQAMDTALRLAIEARQFNLVFQPQVEIRTGRIVGAEVLTRWTHPTLGPVLPARFIPLAEETGLIVELGRWALEAACVEATRWPQDIKVAVNVSPVQFELSDVVSDVAAALAKSGLPPHRLEVEITEGMFVRDFDQVALRLKQLRELGVGIALDDFGTGYSSLSYIGQLPVDKIKVDQSFVKRLPHDPQAAAIVRAIVTLTESLGKRVIAEGIETADQAWMLEMMGCSLAQGYHFGQPMSGDEIASRAAEPAGQMARSA